MRQQQALAEAPGSSRAAQAEFETLEAEIRQFRDRQRWIPRQCVRSQRGEGLEHPSGDRSAARSLHASERERDALAARNSALSLAVDQKDGSSALVAATLSGIRGLVAEHVKITPGYEAAIAAALGTLADAVLADDRDSAIDALAESASRDFGRAGLYRAAPIFLA